MSLRFNIANNVAVFIASIAMATICMLTTALAQVGPYINSTDTGYGNTSPCGNPLNMTINVSESFVIFDLDARFVVSHQWRSDTNVSLRSPAGTTVALLTGPYDNNSFNNYNVRFDDEAPLVVDTGAHLINQSTAGAPMSVRSEGGLLSGFDGENAQGVWTFIICDVYTPSDHGTVRDLELFFTSIAILDVVKSVAVYGPNAYAIPDNDMIYTLTVSNVGGGPTDANSIFLVDPLPAEVTFYNGDVDDGGPETDPVTFSQTGGAGLTWIYSTDIAFAPTGPPPANFAACGPPATTGYDASIRYVCINPKGSMSAGDPDPTFSVSFRTKIN